MEGRNNKSGQKELPAKVVVLDAHGVIFRDADDVAELLVPFVKAHNRVVADSEINELYVKRSLGGMSAIQFWHELGITGNAEALDSTYVRGYRLSPGIRQFLTQLNGNKCQVLCCSNDVAEWSRILRTSHSLESLIGTCVVSGDTASRKPDMAIYVELVKHLTCGPHEAAYVDDKAANLRSGEEAGMNGVLFDQDRTRSGQWAIIATNFPELLKRLRLPGARA